MLNASPTKMFIPTEGRNGGALCLACPIIRTVIFRPVKAQTISALIPRKLIRISDCGI